MPQRPGDVAEVHLEGGVRAWVQYVGPGRSVQLVRVFNSSSHRPHLDAESIEAMVSEDEDYVIEIEWSRFIRDPHVSVCDNLPIPEGKREVPPMRIFVSKSAENPDGWKIAESSGAIVSGGEFRRMHPSIDQRSLPVTDVPMVDTFLMMLSERWRPARAMSYLLG
jgi:hypothetical protein